MQERGAPGTQPGQPVSVQTHGIACVLQEDGVDSGRII